ncbi:heat shock factor protein HSF8-like [Lycium ferocissimum]|uniref:heat shock factor protein HSF8-like n=1 Tax=Lycium ferocissimum TaxID=112874 RepID=UPI002814B3B6|nr:heat shock factor protein HSF8-like [Lycium ferocissimum]
MESNKDEGAAAKTSAPGPAPMGSGNAPPPFLVKTYDMVDDESSDKIVSWSSTNNSFVVWDPPEFARDLLPKYFKHNNFSSFVRQLNTYGFRKVDPDRWEFANEGFLRGQKHLLKSISRRKPAHGHTQQQQQQPPGQSASVGACVEVGKFGLEEEVERLKRDKNVLMQELVRLRQQQQTTDNQLQGMVQRLQGMEQRQQQMMSFLAKAVNSPGFLAQFVQQQNESNRRVAEGSKKRRIKQDTESQDHSVTPADGQIVKYQPVMNEAAKAMLRELSKLDSSPRLENFSNSPESFLIGDGSPQSNESSAHLSGVTLQEVAPTSGQPLLNTASAITGQSLSPAISEIQSSCLGASSEIANNQFPDLSSLVGAQDLPPGSLSASDIIMPELSQLQEILPENNIDIIGSEMEHDSFMDASVGVNGKMPLDIDSFSPDPHIEWQTGLLDDIQELPSVGDPFWEKFLQSPSPGETDEMDPAAMDDISKTSETKPQENGWDKTQNMEQLTEQMGLLTSNKKV